MSTIQQREAELQRLRFSQLAMSHRATAALYATWAREARTKADRDRFVADAREYAAYAKACAERAEPPASSKEPCP